MTNNYESNKSTIEAHRSSGGQFGEHQRDAADVALDAVGSRDEIAARVIAENYGDDDSLQEAIDSGYLDADGVRAMLRAAVELANPASGRGDREAIADQVIAENYEDEDGLQEQLDQSYVDADGILAMLRSSVDKAAEVR